MDIQVTEHHLEYFTPFTDLSLNQKHTLRFKETDVCDCTRVREGGEKGRGTKSQARMASSIKITLLLELHLIFWASKQARRICRSRGPGFHFSSELSLLAEHQNMSWAFDRATSQDYRFMDFFCLWFVVGVFFKLLLERFSGIYLLQASGQGLHEKLCSAGFGFTQACCLI